MYRFSLLPAGCAEMSHVEFRVVLPNNSSFLSLLGEHLTTGKSSRAFGLFLSTSARRQCSRHPREGSLFPRVTNSCLARHRVDSALRSLRERGTVGCCWCFGGSRPVCLKSSQDESMSNPFLRCSWGYEGMMTVHECMTCFWRQKPPDFWPCASS